MNLQIVESGVCVNTSVVPDHATVTSSGASWIASGAIPAGSWPAPSGATLMAQAGAQIGWTLVAGVLVPPTPAAPTLASLQATLVSWASAAAAEVTAAIEPDPTHAVAFNNAAMIVAANGGAAPASTSPFYAAFNANAADYSVTPAEFATMLTAGLQQSQALSVALNTLEAASAAATATPSLATALTAFETAIAAVVAGLNAALPTPIAAPPAIVIVGINA